MTSCRQTTDISKALFNTFSKYLKTVEMSSNLIIDDIQYIIFGQDLRYQYEICVSDHKKHQVHNLLASN